MFVGAVGARRQHGYGNLRLKDGLILGVLSPIGVVAGVVLANSVGERALELSFAAQLSWLAAPRRRNCGRHLVQNGRFRTQ